MAEISKIQPIGSSTQYDLNALKIKINDTAAPSSATTYRIICCNANSGYAETNTTSSFGLYRNSTSNFIVIGNNTIQGGITLHKGNGKYIDIVLPGSLTANKTIAFPDDGGTIALTNNANSGYVRKTGDTMTGQLYINYDQDVGLAQNGSLVIGPKTGTNIGIDGNEIMARNNSAASTLYINSEGGVVYVGSGGLQTTGGLQVWTGNTGGSGQVAYGAGIEIREVGKVTTNQTDWAYAPKIGFHWGGRYVGAFGLHSNGEFYMGTGGSAVNGVLHTGKTYGAVWNDYAEMRNVPEMQKEESILKPGMCVREAGDGTMVLSTKRLEYGCKIISDTFGFCIGETDNCKTPIAVTGRVLAYPYEDIEILKQHIGEPVCSGPNGTVSLMSHEEEKEWPSKILGIISEIPNYNIWYCGAEGKESVDVNGRIWIYVK